MVSPVSVERSLIAVVPLICQAHLLRSRQLLHGARELELKSALEAAKQQVQKREDAVRSMESKVRDLEERVRSLTEAQMEEVERSRVVGEGKENTCGNMDKGTTGASSESGVGIIVTIDGKSAGATGRGSKSPKSLKSTRLPRSPDRGLLEANHPWLSPVLLRLERLSNDSDSDFHVPLNKRYSPEGGDYERGRVKDGWNEIDLTLSRDEDSMDAGSCTYRVDNDIEAVHQRMENAVCTTENGDYKTPEPMSGRLHERPGLPSVREDKVSHAQDSDGPPEGSGLPRVREEEHLKGSRSSLRRRKAVNYALPSLNSKLRQGDAHTFGVADFDRGVTPHRKR